MKHLKVFESFIDENLHVITHWPEHEYNKIPVIEPTHVVIKDCSQGKTLYLRKYDLVSVKYHDDHKRRLTITLPGKSSILGLFEPASSESEHLLPLDSPEGKQFLEDHRGRINGKKFGIFEDAMEYTTDELEKQTIPTHVVKMNIKSHDTYYSPGAKLGKETLAHKFDLVFVDTEGERLVITEGGNRGMIIDFEPGFVKRCLLALDTPEAEEFLHNHRGAIATKKFGI